MSRVGKKIIEIPEKVEVVINGDDVLVKGPKGELSYKKNSLVALELKDNTISVSIPEGMKNGFAFWGLTRSIIANMIEGVSNGFEKKLEVNGVGFKVALKGDTLDMALGFSHPVTFKAPEGISFTVDKNNITVSGIDKVLVGQTAANIRKLKKPEPYKGKGIKYVDEVIRRKAGKKAATA